jgi:hypothetical protein
MYAARIKLDHAVFIGEAAVPNAVVVGVVLARKADVVAGVECVCSVEQHLVSFIDAAISGIPRYDDRLLRRLHLLHALGQL